MPEDHRGQSSPPPVGPQAAIEQARAQLLAGRGPGATPAEITRHTRARPRLGGQPTASERDQLAEHTALALHAADQADALGATVAALRQRLTPIFLVGARRLALTAATLGALLTVATALRHHHRRLDR
ncbi:MAG: hypothetical protein ACRDUW_24675 [Pseudonocardiaceae bacterium]